MIKTLQAIMFKRQNVIITINIILIIVGLYTYIELYNPFFFRFTNEAYQPKGGDYLTEGLFTVLIHFLNLFVFYTFNIVWAIRGFLQKKIRNSVISILAMLLMLSISLFFKQSTAKPEIKIEEVSPSTS